jgi:DNA-binding response OmpR family regulator
MMPGIDGLTVGKTLAADPALCRIPVVMLSALGQGTDIDAGLATGVNDYLVKPFSPWELLDRVGELIAAAQQAG